MATREVIVSLIDVFDSQAHRVSVVYEPRVEVNNVGVQTI